MVNIQSFDFLFQGFAALATPQILLGLFIGCFLGTIVGVLPGLGSTAAMALLLPFTARATDPLFGFVMLAGVWYGCQYGGTVTSVLVNVPGEASTVMTCVDGYKMALKGRAGAALAVAAVGSFIAGTFALILLQFFAPWIAQIATDFGPPEYLALLVVALLLLCNVTGGSFPKSLVSLSLGILFACVGIDAMSGVQRFTMGNSSFVLGFQLAPVAMGLFGIAEIMNMAEKGKKGQAQVLKAPKLRELYPTRAEWRRSGWPTLRGSAVGFATGLVAGAATATFLSYTVEKRAAQHPEEFGRGAIEGVAGPESANNSAVIGSLVPLLSLGLPFTAPAALLLSGLQMFDVQAGPMMVKQHPEVFWGVIAGMYLANIVLVLMNLPLVGLFARLATARKEVVIPTVSAICLVGAYSLRGSMFDVGVMVAFGLIGWAARKLDYPVAPAIIGVVLGPRTEVSFVQTSLMFGGDLRGFESRPVAAAALALALVWVVWSALRATVRVVGIDRTSQPGGPAIPATDPSNPPD